MVVGEAESGSRLDRFLASRFASAPRGQILDAIRTARVLVNDRPARKSHRLKAGDRVAVLALREAADVAASADPSVPFDVLHQDEHLLALSKPPGVPVFPLRAGEVGTLAGGLLSRYPELARIGGHPLQPAIAHRLDTDTSGIVIAARTAEVYEALRDAFRRHKVTKKYVALVHGHPPAARRLENWLEHEPGRPGRMRIVPHDALRRSRRPMRAITSYAVTERVERFSLLAVSIETGVTHQIRCQLAATGFPIAGDRLYGDPSGRGDPSGLVRQFLHAAALELRHPVTGVHLRIEAPLAADLARVLDPLRSHAS